MRFLVLILRTFAIIKIGQCLPTSKNGRTPPTVTANELQAYKLTVGEPFVLFDTPALVADADTNTSATTMGRSSLFVSPGRLRAITALRWQRYCCYYGPCLCDDPIARPWPSAYENIWQLRPPPPPISAYPYPGGLPHIPFGSSHGYPVPHIQNTGYGQGNGYGHHGFGHAHGHGHGHHSGHYPHDIYSNLRPLPDNIPYGTLTAGITLTGSSPLEDVRDRLDDDESVPQLATAKRELIQDGKGKSMLYSIIFSITVYFSKIFY